MVPPGVAGPRDGGGDEGTDGGDGDKDGKVENALGMSARRSLDESVSTV
jgi:hypothetical protein